MAQPSARKLRLLCLHGMYQNADTFAAKTKHLRALQRTDDAVEYIYIDGPFSVTPPILAKKAQQHASASRDTVTPSRPPRPRDPERLFRAWWRPSGLDQAGPTQLDSDRDVLLAFLRAQLAELGDIDGVLGFSQGASLASWLCSTQARLELRWSPRIAILIGSYLGPQQYSLASGILPATSSLHMFGLNDHVISAAKSRAVVDVFRHAQDPASHVETSIHSQGHVVPKCDAALAQFHAFLAQHAPQSLSAGTNPNNNTASAASLSPQPTGSSTAPTSSPYAPQQPPATRSRTAP